jgi:site-specific recombinase XerD
LRWYSGGIFFQNTSPVEKNEDYFILMWNSGDLDLPEDESMGLIRIVEGGGRRGREIPVNSKACKVLKRYLETRTFSSTRALFINRFSKPMRPRGIQKMLHKYLRQLEIYGVSVHSLRHTFGVHHAVQGTQLETIQNVMGHKDIRSLEIYIMLAKQQRMREIEENAL